MSALVLTVSKSVFLQLTCMQCILLVIHETSSNNGDNARKKSISDLDYKATTRQTPDLEWK